MPAAGKTILFLSFLLSSITSSGQDTVLLFQQPSWDSAYNMEEYARYYVDITNKLDPLTASRQQFTPDSDFSQAAYVRYAFKRATAWIRWIIKNPSQHDEEVLLLFHRMSFLSFYYEDSGGLHFVKNNSAFISSATKNERRGFRFTVPGGHTVKVYACMHDMYQNFAREFPIIIRPAEFQDVVKNMLYENRYFEYSDVLFLAIIFFVTIHTLAQYFFNQRREFLLYAFYSFSVLLFSFFKFDEPYYNDIFLSHFPYIQKYGNNPFTYLMFFGYYRFVRSFIDFKEIAPWFNRIIIITEKILLLSIVADIILALLNMYLVKIMIFNTVRIYLVCMAFAGIYLLFKTGNLLPRFIAVGSGCFVFGALLAMVLSWLQKDHTGNRFDPIIYMQIGMVIELLCFTLGLSYKTSLIEKEKITTQRQLIVQLEENKELQAELTTRLETRVKEQTSHILEQQRQLEKEKEQQLTLEFTKKITEMELQLLKSQLNPHFYFNTLNNLYGLAMIAPKKAPDAILKLSDIMEYVIYDCRNDKVPVEKELRFINSYIELEKLRYDDSASISLKVSGDAHGKHISPLLLVQFIENAFKHGLEENKRNSYLRIHIIIENGRLLYESVNSIGSGNPSTSGGVGLTNVRKRLEIIYPSRHQLHIHSENHEYTVQLVLQFN